MIGERWLLRGGRPGRLGRLKAANSWPHTADLPCSHATDPGLSRPRRRGCTHALAVPSGRGRLTSSSNGLTTSLTFADLADNCLLLFHPYRLTYPATLARLPLDITRLCTLPAFAACGVEAQRQHPKRISSPACISMVVEKGPWRDEKI